MAEWTRLDGPVLRVADLDVTFYVRRSLFATRPVRAVTGVSLDLAKGETVAVVGESGSGKTTLGRATLRLVPISAGRIIFEGVDIDGLSGRRLLAFRQRAQAIFQDPFSSLSPYMRVGELVEEPLVIHGPADRAEREASVLAALEQVKLSPAAEFADKYPAHPLWRAATTRQHRPRHGARARLPRGRRAGLHDRCLQPRGDPVPARRAAAAARADLPVHHA